MVSIYFDDAKLLKEKDPVVQDEMLIGRVERIDLLRDGRIEVSARIMKQYIPRTRARSTAYISAGAEGNAYQLTLYALDSEGEVLDSGYRIEGADSWAALQIKRAAAKARELGRDLTRDR